MQLATGPGRIRGGAAVEDNSLSGVQGGIAIDDCIEVDRAMTSLIPVTAATASTQGVEATGLLTSATPSLQATLVFPVESPIPVQVPEGSQPPGRAGSGTLNFGGFPVPCPVPKNNSPTGGFASL